MEAREEPLPGQLAVAQVVLNRVEDERYPDTICDVVTQGSPPGDALPARKDCQFSWRCDGKPDKPYDALAWQRSIVVAKLALIGARLPEVGNATHYHADYVSPSWARGCELIAKIGRHIFYLERA